MTIADDPLNRTAVLTAWGDWLHDIGGWQWFVTLTLRDPKPSSGTWSRPGWAQANRAWEAFVLYVRPPVGHLQWVRLFEMQSGRGVPHVHGLVKGLEDTRFKEVSAFMWERYGFNRILEYRPELGATHYITKYVVKDLGDVRFSDGFLTTTQQ